MLPMVNGDVIVVTKGGRTDPDAVFVPGLPVKPELLVVLAGDIVEDPNGAVDRVPFIPVVTDESEGLEIVVLVSGVLGVAVVVELVVGTGAVPGNTSGISLATMAAITISQFDICYSCKPAGHKQVNEIYKYINV